MKSHTQRTASVFAAAVLMLGLAQYPGFARASEPNNVNNETIDTGRDPDVPLNMQRGGTGIYDRYDAYRTPQGFPLPGWEYLRGMS